MWSTPLRLKPCAGRQPRIPLRPLAIAVAALMACAVAPARADQAGPPSFHRQVVPVLSRLGCNAGGACHGTVLGQNGFRLSLFGGQPAADHYSLTREFAARRLSVLQPEQSLMLLKATGQVSHGGGKRTAVDSGDYQILREWIAAGAPLDNPAASRVARLVVAPVDRVLKVNETCQLRVTASYADGSSADVTHLCRFETRDANVADFETSGTLRARAVGATAVVVRYGAEPVLCGITVMPVEPRPFPAVKPHNFIDEHVLAKLRTLGMPPADLCDDATFLRRLHLDVTGLLPPADEVRAFLASTDPDKRNRKIDEVLARPGHAELWAAKFCDLLKPTLTDRAGNGYASRVAQRRVFEWMRSRLAENVPYDELVERILVSSTLDGRSPEQWISDHAASQQEVVAHLQAKKPPSDPPLTAYSQRRTLDLFWHRYGAQGIVGGVQFAHAILGLRLQCAQCHRHPYDVWQQDDILSFANFFVVQRKNSPEMEAYLEGAKDDLKKWPEELKTLGKSKEPEDKARAAQLQAKLAAIGELRAQEVTAQIDGKTPAVTVTNNLGTQRSSTLRLLGEKTSLQPTAGQDTRRVVIDWLRRPDNPYFARAIVNRVWAHYFGRGIIDPPDQLSPLNPPSHPQLLDELCREFIQHKYDLQWLHRQMLGSRTYQQRRQAHDLSRHDQSNYARFHPRRLSGEVILDVINQATGGKDKYPPTWFARDGERAVAVAGLAIDELHLNENTLANRYLFFGRQRRQATVQCDCAQSCEVTLPQMFFLANHPEVRAKISAADGRAAQLAADPNLTNAQRIENLCLAALGRLPSPAELQGGLDHLQASSVLSKGLEEVLWSLLNTWEFQLNY